MTDMLTWGEWLRDLQATGRVRVSPLPLTDSPDSADCLEQVIAGAVADCPGEPPPADRALVRQALEVLHRACQLLVLRDFKVEAVPNLPGSGAIAHWSIDIAFRHLPQVHRLACARSPDDPLSAWISETVHPWPLSAIGIAQASPGDPAPVLAHPALALLYRDRCLATSDDVRSQHPMVIPLLSAAIGAHPEAVLAQRACKGTA